MIRTHAAAAARKAHEADPWACAQVRAATVPALVATGDGDVIVANEKAAPLLAHEAIDGRLRLLVAEVHAADRLGSARLTTRHQEGARHFELTLIPTADANVLVVGREVTLESNLVAALTASRELFRDLTLCSSEFAFETDARGTFVWTSQGGLLGYSAGELHGARAGELVDQALGSDCFASRQKVEAREIWCRTKDGAERCISVTAIPVVDKAGGWRGSRGVARDVTELRLREREAAGRQRREKLIAAVVDAMRSQVEPRRIMLAAADALLAATASQRATIRTVRLGLYASVGAQPAGEAREVAATTTHRGEINGQVCLVRGAEGEAFGEEEKALLDAIVPHLGVAVALAEALEPSSGKRLDALTGLLNRQGFDEECVRRLGALARKGKAGALVLLDCHDFAAVTHSIGRAASDDLLAAIGRMLRSGGGEEIAARTEGDEFALLVEDGRDAVTARAQAIGRGFQALREELKLDIDVSPSIGIAVIEPEAGEPMDGLAARARSALCRAKHQGRNRFVFADSSNKVVSC